MITVTDQYQLLKLDCIKLNN